MNCCGVVINKKVFKFTENFACYLSKKLEKISRGVETIRKLQMDERHSNPQICTNCGKPASFLCPDCKKFNANTAASTFCSQACFKENWKAHKHLHNIFKILGCELTSSNPKVIEHSYDINGVVISEEKGLGRVLRATKFFATGDVVLQEKPLVLYSGTVDLVRKYIRMSEEDKSRLLDMKHISKPEDAVYERARELAEATWKEAERCTLIVNDPSISVNDVFRILSVATSNGHKFRGQQEAFKSNVSEQNFHCCSALFSVGSKAAHSCIPNCCYTSKVLDGQLIYFAVRPISIGENITFSYIVSHVSTLARRKQLKLTKDFYCECLKCNGLDFTNGYYCKKQGCYGVKLCNYGNSDSTEKWYCQLCKDNELPNMSVFDNIHKHFNDLNARINYGVIPEHAETAEKLIAEATEKLSPTHYLVVEMFHMLSTINDSLAAVLEQQPGFRKDKVTVNFLRGKSAEAHFNAVRTIECINAGCLMGYKCGIQHPVSHDCIQSVFWACMDLKDTEQHLPSFVSSYLPLLELTFGNKDVDVLAIISKIKRDSKSSKMSVNTKG